MIKVLGSFPILYRGVTGHDHILGVDPISLDKNACVGFAVKAYAWPAMSYLNASMRVISR